MKEDEVSKLADEIAEGTSKFFSEKFGRTLTDIERFLERQEAIISNLTKLESRLNTLESSFSKHIDNFRTVAVETDRLVTEKYEELSKRDESFAITLSEDIQKLKESIITLNNEINKLRVNIESDKKL